MIICIITTMTINVLVISSYTGYTGIVNTHILNVFGLFFFNNVIKSYFFEIVVLWHIIIGC